MGQYENLVKALRGKFIAYDVTGNHNSAQLYKDAADAIERITAMHEKAEMDATNLTGKLAQAEADIDRLNWEIDKRIATEIELSNQVDALQAEVERLEPKRGKWIGVSPMVDTVQCSVCGGQLFSAELETPYCPYCGAKMEVQE